MAYTPTEWKDGDVITAEKLNNIESGIGSSNKNELIITISENNGSYIADKEYQTILEAYNNGLSLKVKKFDSENNYWYQYPLSFVSSENIFYFTYTRYWTNNNDENELYTVTISISPVNIIYNKMSKII